MGSDAWDWIEMLLCRTIGCTGPFSRWFMWPHRHICTPYAFWRYRQDNK
jgi:hypothetical protein